MKRTTTLIAALLLVIGATFATEGKENSGSKITVVKWKEQTHRLFYTDKNEGKVRVRIVNEAGNTVMLKTFKNEFGFSVPFNFKEQEAGNYQILVTDASGTYTDDIQVGS